jgi:hypothetical protein
MRATSEQLGYVKQRVATGDYRVDARRVAAAILQRIGAATLDRQINAVGDRNHRPEAHHHPGA